MIMVTYSFDASIREALIKGNFSRMKEAVESYGALGDTYLITQDVKNYSYLFDHVTHIPSALSTSFGLRHLTYILFGVLNLIRFRDRYKIIRGYGVGCLHAAIAKKLLKKHFIVSYHYNYSKQVSEVTHGWLFGKIVELSENFILRNADVVIACTQRLKDHAMGKGAQNVVVIPNYVDTEKFNISIKSQKVIEKHSLLNKKVILFAGRLHPIKRVDDLIKAFRIVRNEMNNVVLLIVGDGNERERLTKLATKLNLSDSIIFCGFVSHDWMPEYFSVADIFVLPSMMEGHPVVLVEAMACGTPIIGTNVEGICDIINDGFSGLLAQIGNPDELAKKILQLLFDDRLYALIRKNGIQLAKKEYSKEVVIKKELMVIKEVVNKMEKNGN